MTSVVIAKGQQLPTSSSNAALHYQRAILFLANLDPAQRKSLAPPIWEIITPGMSEQQTNAITRLLLDGRHAIRAGLFGAAQGSADFGADHRAYGSPVLLPHVGAMQELARLVAVYGMHQQGNQDWSHAADTFLAVLRMGEHMTRQSTLAESTEGVRILETGYYCLASWAAHCPDKNLIANTRKQFLAIGPLPNSPLMQVSCEAAIVDSRLDYLQGSYPNGNWAEMAMAFIDTSTISEPITNLEELVKAQAIRLGIPASVFSSPEEFRKYVEQLRKVNQEYYSRALSALTLPSKQAILEGQNVFREFSPQLTRLGDTGALNPGQIAAFYATHQAEHNLLNVALALNTQREGELFPQDLSGVTTLLGGTLPGNPLGEGELKYEPTNERRGYRLSYPASQIAEIELPQVAFDFNSASGND